MKKINLYHGSEHIIEQPIYGEGKLTNDYGLGFYCTENIELAKEWACVNSESSGYVNKYEIDLAPLKILDLTSDEYSILNWMAILVKNRTFDTSSTIASMAKDFLIQKYYIDVQNYDIIIGYRADDSYFKFAKDFLNNTITMEKLSQAMTLGELGKQVVLISRLAFDCIVYTGYEDVDNKIYYSKRMIRDRRARSDYANSTNDSLSGTFMSDIIRNGGVK